MTFHMSNHIITLTTACMGSSTSDLAGSSETWGISDFGTWGASAGGSDGCAIGHEWMRNTEEPVNVVWRTLTWHNTWITCCCQMVWVVRPRIIYVIIWHPSPMDEQGVQECTGRSRTGAQPSPVCIWQQQAPSGPVQRSTKSDEITVFFVTIHRHACGDTSS